MREREKERGREGRGWVKEEGKFLIVHKIRCSEDGHPTYKLYSGLAIDKELRRSTSYMYIYSVTKCVGIHIMHTSCNTDGCH